jgi:transposase-like protein
MTKINKVISADVKAQILDRVKEGIPIAQLAQEHGISNRTIYGWLSKGATSSQPSWVEYNKLKRENQALKELIGHITYEKTMAQKKI